MSFLFLVFGFFPRKFVVFGERSRKPPHPPSNEKGGENEKTLREGLTHCRCYTLEKSAAHTTSLFFFISLSLSHSLSLIQAPTLPLPLIRLILSTRTRLPLAFFLLHLILNFWDPELLQLLLQPLPPSTPMPLQRLMIKEWETSKAREGSRQCWLLTINSTVIINFSLLRFSLLSHQSTHPHVCVGSFGAL